MPLYVVSSPSGRQVIVNANSPGEALQTGNSFVDGPAQARLATAADAQTIPLLGSVIQGDSRPAIQADPEFLRSMGLVGGDGGGGDGGGGGGVAGAANLEQIDPFAAFLRTFRTELGPLRGTLAERQVQGRAAPAGTAFTGGELLRSVRDPTAQAPSFGDESAFANWLASQGIGANFRGQSAQAFGDLASIASQRAAAKGGGGAINDPVLRQILNPTGDPQGQAIAGAVSELGEEAFRSRFSPIVANALARGPLFDPGRQLSEFRAGTGTQGFGDFVTFLRNRFGMGF